MGNDQLDRVDEILVAIFLTILLFVSYYLLFYPELAEQYEAKFWQGAEARVQTEDLLCGGTDDEIGSISILAKIPKYFANFVEREISLEVTNETKVDQTGLLLVSGELIDAKTLEPLEKYREVSFKIDGERQEYLKYNLPACAVQTYSLRIFIPVSDPERELKANFNFLHSDSDYESSESMKVEYQNLTWDIIDAVCQNGEGEVESICVDIDGYQVFRHSAIQSILLPPWSNGLLPFFAIGIVVMANATLEAVSWKKRYPGLDFIRIVLLLLISLAYIIFITAVVWYRLVLQQDAIMGINPEIIIKYMLIISSGAVFFRYKNPKSWLLFSIIFIVYVVGLIFWPDGIIKDIWGEYAGWLLVLAFVPTLPSVVRYLAPRFNNLEAIIPQKSSGWKQLFSLILILFACKASPSSFHLLDFDSSPNVLNLVVTSFTILLLPFAVIGIYSIGEVLYRLVIFTSEKLSDKVEKPIYGFFSGNHQIVRHSKIFSLLFHIFKRLDLHQSNEQYENRLLADNYDDLDVLQEMHTNFKWWLIVDEAHRKKVIAFINEILKKASQVLEKDDLAEYSESIENLNRTKKYIEEVNIVDEVELSIINIERLKSDLENKAAKIREDHVQFNFHLNGLLLVKNYYQAILWLEKDEDKPRTVIDENGFLSGERNKLLTQEQARLRIKSLLSEQLKLNVVRLMNDRSSMTEEVIKKLAEDYLSQIEVLQIAKDQLSWEIGVLSKIIEENKSVSPDEVKAD